MNNTQHKPLRLALIGMSGAGKTFWARKLALAGHRAVSCDDRIEECLRPHLVTGGYGGINGVAAWMGWPDSSRYASREAHYLEEEIAGLRETLNELETHPARGVVLDTTGSVIYAGDRLLRRLQAQMTLVYLSASAEEEQLLIERYLSDPKPVLWRGAFQPRPGEAALETVRRCYPALIAARRQSYEALAHVVIPISHLRDAALNAAGFLALIERELERRR